MHTEFITALSTLGSAVHQCLGIAPAHVITTLLRYWYQDSPPGEIVSLGVLSEGKHPPLSQIDTTSVSVLEAMCLANTVTSFIIFLFHRSSVVEHIVGSQVVSDLSPGQSQIYIALAQ